MQAPLLVILAGPTASGKTRLAIELAQALSTEIISFDSRQFYREMHIGTAAPTAEELLAAPHHFIADRSFHEHLSAGAFENEANRLIEQLFIKYPVLIAVGGSGLFAQAMVQGFDDMSVKNEESRGHWKAIFEAEGLTPLQTSLRERDPKYATEVDMQNHQRIIRALEVIDTTGKPFSAFRKKQPKQRPYRCVWIGTEVDRGLLHERINQRVLNMLEQGLEAEARALYPFKQHESLQTVGYRELFDYFDGLHDRDEAIRLIQRNTRHFARRQMTWFRKNEEMHWLAPEKTEEILQLVRSFRA
ncbi:MAG: tRNA (adenosine(37)-N6)-dimethylallyltransferase MiaA [Bacteroidia bacterium]